MSTSPFKDGTFQDYELGVNGLMCLGDIYNHFIQFEFQTGLVSAV
jgi:hypothetical protein